MDNQEATTFAREWIEAWNTHDLDRVLSHYAEDFQMSSPFIAVVTGEASGTLTGKERVAAYWRAALERMPDLRFELEGVLTGADSVVIVYRTNHGRQAAEVFFFDETGLVNRAAAHYATAVM